MKHEKPEPGKHRDPVGRRRKQNEDPSPEVIGVPILEKLDDERKSDSKKPSDWIY